MFSAKKNEIDVGQPKNQRFAQQQPPAPPKPFGAYANLEQNYSIINEWLTMRGDLESSGDILIKGKVLGNIRCKMLIIDKDAHVEGRIDTEEVVIRGATRGLIHSNIVRIENTARVNSEIYHVTFSTEEGARVRGSLYDLETTPEMFTSVETLTDVTDSSSPVCSVPACREAAE